MWVGKKQNFIGSAGVVGSHSVLIFFFVFVCRLVNFHVAVFFFGLLVTDWRYVFVADFEALSCQNRRKYIRFRNAETHTVSAIKHTACYRLAFYSISPSIHLSVNPCSSNNFFVSSAFLFPITMSMFGSLSIQIL